MNKKKARQDPHINREAKRYREPIASREHIADILKKHGKPSTRRNLEKILDITSTQQREGLRRRLKAMVRDGQLIENRNKQYALIEELELVKGEVKAERGGTGTLFVKDDNRDIRLNHHQMRDVIPGDIILTRLHRDKHGQFFHAVIVEVIKRIKSHVVAYYVKKSGVHLARPIDKYFKQMIALTHLPSDPLNEGDYILVKILTYPSYKQQPIGMIDTHLGDVASKNIATKLAIDSYQLPTTWKAESLAELDKFTEQSIQLEAKNREDWRHMPFVTIDGEHSKDFDDAVYVTTDDQGGWILYVAIADVSHYVKLGSSLDTEAMEKGTSVYFSTAVMPMLPEKLSNELCSLQPDVDRLALGVQIHIDRSGKKTRASLHQIVIKSHARLTYTQVAQMMDATSSPPAWWKQTLSCFEQLLNQLLKQRRDRNALDFETQEKCMILDDENKLTRIEAISRNRAHILIEECMLQANVAVAEWAQNKKLPILYRVHGIPNAEKLSSLHAYLKPLSLKLHGGNTPSNEDFRRLLQDIATRPDFDLLQTVILRTMQPAVYQPINIGHFGLAYPIYLHFTSPIRRYPDLMVHRVITAELMKDETPIHYPVSTQAIGVQCSYTERRADEAVRYVDDWLKCEYMQDKIGHTYQGKITAVTSFGLFVMLHDIYIEGLIHISALENDYYEYLPELHQLKGKSDHNCYQLGDELTVKVKNVDILESNIDFILAD